jgi:hypothetical protein
MTFESYEVMNFERFRLYTKSFRQKRLYSLEYVPLILSLIKRPFCCCESNQ